ncbi:hypothetical protein TeGR_g8335 [Tetraparma gracilis]|uniref:Uncharacterized protein n=1 Tax=Tetraparma gracilis TaxID=2962635 RepID=A0ABQ6NDT3_9STRA|nr:hypothetical protein TeGR_g8335 [Tetraparma gracilis]
MKTLRGTGGVKEEVATHPVSQLQTIATKRTEMRRGEPVCCPACNKGGQEHGAKGKYGSLHDRHGHLKIDGTPSLRWLGREDFERWDKQNHES